MAWLVVGCGGEEPTATPPPSSPTPAATTATTASPAPTVSSFALPAGVRAGPASFATCEFRQWWEHSDKLVSEGGAGERGYTWGPSSFGAFEEPYQDAAGGKRLVQYFDKGRMELLVNGQVGGGLLTKEMISGQIQTGDNSFEPRPPSLLPVVGDAVSNNPSPNYTGLNRLMSQVGGPAPVSRLGQPVVQALNSQAEVVSLAAPPAPVNIGHWEPATGRNVPEVFVNFQKQSGRVWWNNSRYIREQVFSGNLTGLPLSEPYWIRALVGGQERDTLMQLFERRILTYTPANPDPYKVEMSNLGQHYFQWRYANPPTPYSGTCQPQDLKVLPRLAAHDQVYVPSLMFHQIRHAPEDPFSNTPELLVEVLNWLQSNNYNPVTVAQVADFLLEGTPLPPKPVILRFDDGWKSQVIAAEELQKRGITATFFVMTNAPGPYLYGQDFVKLEKMGFEIGAHTRTHAKLTRIPNPKIEIEGNRQDLEKLLGHPIRSFAYPFGLYNQAVRDMVKDAKFDTGVTVDQGAIWRRSTMYAQPNITMEGINTLDQFIRRFNSVR